MPTLNSDQIFSYPQAENGHFVKLNVSDTPVLSAYPQGAYAEIVYIINPTDIVNVTEYFDHQTFSNSSGNTEIVIGENNLGVQATITFSGVAGTRIVILSTTNANEGDTIDLRYLFPATANIVVETRNATSGGTLLDTLTTDTSGDDAALQLRYTGTAWELLSALYPA